MAGRDELFKKGVALGQPKPPPRTYTEILLQSNDLVLVTVTDNDGGINGYQLRFVDRYFNRSIIFPLSPEQALEFQQDFADLLSGQADDPEPTGLQVIEGGREGEATDSGPAAG